MMQLLANTGLAFLEGLALILSPCIWPILPIVLSGSLGGGRARPLGIISGFIAAFTAVTLSSRALVVYLHIEPDILRNASYVILILLGIIMLSNYLTERFAQWTSRLANVGHTSTTINKNDFSGGFIFGCLIGVVWTPCAGPILAAVIVQAIVQQTTIATVSVVLAFAMGAGVPMLLIALLGRRLLAHVTFFRNKTELLRKVLGVIIILSVIFLIYSGSAVSAVSETKTTSNNQQGLINGLAISYTAPTIAGIDAWINSPPLTIESLKGKVVLIDFWTYSCINCIRTLPYIKEWYSKYHNQGLVVIGVHSPEFAFEQNLDNVKRAVETFGIRYPVALDNKFVTWLNFQNKYWPAHYLINKEGKVVYVHFGEGEYATTEHNIRYLLGLDEALSKQKEKSTHLANQTPELYLGYKRMAYFASPELLQKNVPATYSYPNELRANYWALQGSWKVGSEMIEALAAGAALKLHFYADAVYAVMGTKNGSIEVTIRTKGKDKKLTVKGNQLYTIVETTGDPDGTVELIADKPGLEMYTFTFGS